MPPAAAVHPLGRQGGPHYAIKMLQAVGLGKKTGETKRAEAFDIAFGMLTAGSDHKGFRVHAADGLEDFHAIQAAAEIEIEQNGAVGPGGVQAVFIGLQGLIAGGHRGNVETHDFGDLAQGGAHALFIIDDQQRGWRLFLSRSPRNR